MEDKPLTQISFKASAVVLCPQHFSCPSRLQGRILERSKVSPLGRNCEPRVTFSIGNLSWCRRPSQILCQYAQQPQAFRVYTGVGITNLGRVAHVNLPGGYSTEESPPGGEVLCTDFIFLPGGDSLIE